MASRGPRFSSSRSTRYASYSILEVGEVYMVQQWSPTFRYFVDHFCFDSIFSGGLALHNYRPAFFAKSYCACHSSRCIHVIWDELWKWETVPCLCLLLRVFNPPGSLVLLGVDHSVLNGFVDQSVHVRCEGINGRRQSLTTLRHKPLSLCIHTKLHLTERQRERAN